MEIAWTGQLVEDLPRGPAGVDDAQNLLLLLQAGGRSIQDSVPACWKETRRKDSQCASAMGQISRMGISGANS